MAVSAAPHAHGYLWLRSGSVVLSCIVHPELYAQQEENDTDHRRKPGKYRNLIRPKDHKARIVRDERDGQDKCEDEPEHRIENGDRVLRKILHLQSQIQDEEGIRQPEAGRCSRILHGDHDQRRRDQEYDQLTQSPEGKGQRHMCPCVGNGTDSECQLSQPLHIKDLRLIVEEQIDGTEAVFYEITGIHIHPKAPVVIEKTLHRSQGYQ